MTAITRSSIVIVTTILVSASALVAACGGGSDADLPALATEAANVQPQVQVTVVADDLKFDTDTIVVPADQEISITLDNQDAGTLHNVAVYTSIEGEDRREIYRGDLFNGRETRTYTFTAPAPGVYLFRCDAHPDMEGVFIAR
jgi:plastocyanin